MRMAADLGRPLVIALRARNDGQPETRGLRSVGNMLIGGKPRIERLADEADQRADPQRQKRNHLLEHAKPCRHVLRIHRRRPHAFIEQERRDADHDLRIPEPIRRAPHRRQQRQRLAGVIGDIDRGSLWLADQLRGEPSIDLIDGAALAAEDQLGVGLQERQFYRQQRRHVVMDAVGHGEQRRQRGEPRQQGQRQRGGDPACGGGLDVLERSSGVGEKAAHHGAGSSMNREGRQYEGAARRAD